MNKEKIERLIKTLSSDSSSVSKAVPLVYTIARVVIGFIVVSIVGFVIYKTNDHSEEIVRVDVTPVSSVINLSSPMEIAQNRYTVLVAIEDNKKELDSLKLKILEKKSELSKIEAELDNKRNKIKNEPAFRKEVKEEVFSKVLGDIQERDSKEVEEARREGYKEGKNEGHGSGIVDGLILYHLFK